METINQPIEMGEALERVSLQSLADLGPEYILSCLGRILPSESGSQVAVAAFNSSI